MGKALSPLLMVLGALIFFAGQWIAFEIYANTKLSRIGENLSQFVHGLYSGDTLIKLNRGDESIFILRTAGGKVITTNNAMGPLKVEDFISAGYSKGGNHAYAYIKRVSFSEYLNVFIERPFALGVSISGLILFLSGIVLLLKRDVGIEGKERSEFLTREELARRLKALKVAFAMSGVIPKESLSEAKKILDDIIKRMEGKT
ncbi:hypothetical protein [Pampinifervens florentissimum]|uniref:hypothetical protein n=1 Tax=Pampinifervens florentissimum TaxID=1632019 RepID=UPI0013B4974F|nr:hypothetical protein [Hydrogenobacter sp. T-8]QID32435.1 hypothetical protein G3M65_01010 [Hydrogenobacter sp. T-8]